MSGITARVEIGKPKKIDSTLTDIMLICKGWYNKEKYESVLKALKGYYHKHYGCHDIVMDKGFANYLFLQPLVLEAINAKPQLARYLFEPRVSFLSNKESYVEVNFERMLGLIHMIEHNTFGVSEYQDMFDRAEACKHEDDTIGII